MSIYKNKRKPSEPQFLQTARDIQVNVISMMSKIPNKYKYLIATYISELAASCHTSLKKGNSMYPKTQRDAQRRADLFIDAKTGYQALISQIGVVEEFYEFSETSITELMLSVEKEINLIKKLIETDEQRYANLP